MTNTILIDALEAAQARIAELEANIELKADFIEATINNAAKTYQDGFESGRRQGLDEALGVTVPSTSWGTEGLPQKWSEAIEALKKGTTS